MPTRDNRILFATRYFLLDDSNGAAVASRALLSCLRRNGFAVEALCGTLVDAGQAQDPAEVLKAHNLAFESHGAEALEISMAGVLTRDPSRLVSSSDGVPLTMLVNCGIALRRRGNVFLMEQPPQPPRLLGANGSPRPR